MFWRGSTSRVAAGLMVALLAPGLSADDGITIEPREKWSNIYGGKEAVFHYVVKSPQPFKGRAAWTLSTNGRTISRGESDLTTEPDKPGTVKIRLDIPPVKEGVAVRTSLTLSVSGAEAGKPQATHEKTLWFFPDNPFADRAQWLKDLKIHLFDPAETTAAVLKKMDIPFEEVSNPDAIDELKQGLLVIGEGVSFQEQRGLPELMVKAAANGLPVLCLAPRDGMIPIPGSEGAADRSPRSLAWMRQDIISSLDKRLDAEAWPQDGKLIASTLVIKADGSKAVAEVRKEPAGWSWLEVTFAEPDTKLVVCGFAVMAKWESGPTPRFLFARLLEHVAQKREKPGFSEKPGF